MIEASTIYPLSAVRAVALHAQGLTASNERAPVPAPASIQNLVEQLGCIQIDTLQMVHRSQYLAVWSRLGNYATGEFDSLLYDPQDRRLFEYWAHAASIIPLKAYRYTLPRKHLYKETENTWNMRMLSEAGNAGLVKTVYERIQQAGALRAADFEKPAGKGGTWWDWKPAKRALEHLYDAGDLMIAGRKNFQRIYDLSERVLPDWVDQRPPAPEEAERYFVEQAAQVLGIFRPEQLATYYYMKQTTVKPILQAMLLEGILLTVQARLANGKDYAMLIHRNNLATLEQAADDDLATNRTTFLSPFDNLFWAKERDQQLWNFRKALEAYTPAHKRVHGYFCLPILHRDRLVGRFDPKLERKSKLLRLKALYLEPDIAPDEDLVAGTALAIRDFLAFHGAETLVIENSQPAEFGAKLLKAL